MKTPYICLFCTFLTSTGLVGCGAKLSEGGQGKSARDTHSAGSASLQCDHGPVKFVLRKYPGLNTSSREPIRIYLNAFLSVHLSLAPIPSVPKHCVALYYPLLSSPCPSPSRPFPVMGDTKGCIPLAYPSQRASKPLQVHSDRHLKLMFAF